MKILDKGIIDLDPKEYALMRSILASARVNIETRDILDAEDRKMLKMIDKMVGAVTI